MQHSDENQPGRVGQPTASAGQRKQETSAPEKREDAASGKAFSSLSRREIAPSDTRGRCPSGMLMACKYCQAAAQCKGGAAMCCAVSAFGLFESRPRPPAILGDRNKRQCLLREYGPARQQQPLLPPASSASKKQKDATCGSPVGVAISTPSVCFNSLGARSKCLSFTIMLSQQRHFQS